MSNPYPKILISSFDFSSVSGKMRIDEAKCRVVELEANRNPTLISHFSCRLQQFTPMVNRLNLPVEPHYKAPNGNVIMKEFKRLPMRPVPTVSATTSEMCFLCVSLTKTTSIIPTNRMKRTRSYWALACSP